MDSIAITGANDKEGRTTTAVNLAFAISQTGRQVLLVGADRRNDSLDRIFGLAGRHGLSDFLRSVGDLEAARTAIDTAEDHGGITVLPTGTGTPSPMANNSIAALLAVAEERNMIVIFDVPPARTNAEGLQVAAIVDAVYIVAALGRTKRSELRELRIQLVNVQADVAGAILNRTSRLNLLPTGGSDVSSVTVPSAPVAPNRAENVENLASVRKGRFGQARDGSEVEEANVVSERSADIGEHR